MKFAKTIHLDVSDAKAFPHAARTGEWAVAGTFAFTEAEPRLFSNKERLAFRNGWLGLESFGRATFVEVALIPEQQFEDVVRRLGAHLREAYCAPDMLAAVEAARHEVKDMAGLCDHPAGTLLSIERQFTDEGIDEIVRVIPPQGDGAHARIWQVVEDEGT